MKIGNYEVRSVLTGTFALDGGAMFGTVPKVMWNKTNPADEKNRIQMEARCLLLISSEKKILVDVGLGNKFDSKFQDIFKVDQNEVSLEKSLEGYGVGRDEITDVVLTHLHFDHAGGATTLIGGELQPTFPKANYFVQKKNLETALKPNSRERASYLKENFEPLIKANSLQLLDGPVENLFPDLSVFVTNGHTQAQQLVRVGREGAGESLVYCGDIIPTSSHVRAPYVMGYDLNPLLVIEEKNSILERASQFGSLIFFEHDPYMDAARIKKEGSDFQIIEKVHLH